MMYRNELKFAKVLAKKAGKVMLQYFSIEKQVQYKDDASPVTIADKKINRLVIDELTKKFDYGIIGEEESTTSYGKDETVWICDPIDGTKAFIHGIPTFMFSLALVKKGSPVLGVTYDPVLDRLFWAVRTKGSFCNGTRLSVSKNPLKGHSVGVGSEVAQIYQTKPEIEKLFSLGAEPVCAEGAVFKTCLVAEGKFVGYMSKLPKTHDLAAAYVILVEAGGKMTATDGSELDFSRPFIGAIASNKLIHDELLEIQKVSLDLS